MTFNRNASVGGNKARRRGAGVAIAGGGVVGVGALAVLLISVLTGTDLTLPVTGGRLALGTWQGVYLWEHRHRPHRRKLTVTVLGDA